MAAAPRRPPAPTTAAGSDGATRRRPAATGPSARRGPRAAGPARVPVGRGGRGLRRGQDPRRRRADRRHRRAGVPAVRHRRRPRERRRASSPPWPTPSPAAMGFAPDAGDVDAHPVRGGHPARPEGLRLQPPAVLDQPGARGGRQLQRAVLHRQPGHPRLRRLARRRRPTTISRLPGPAHRRRRRHDQPDLRHRRAPADRGPVRLQRQRRRQAGARRPADRRHRRRPADGAVHHRRRDRGLRRCSASSRPSRAAEGEPWGLLFAKDNPLVECADLALAALDRVGQLDDITDASG